MSARFSLHLQRGLLRGLVLLCLLLSVPLARAEPLSLGINSMWGPGDEASLRKRFKQAKAVGVTQVRLDWEWRQVESTRGTYNWQALDTLVQAAKAEQIELLPIVHYAPAWALRTESKPDEVYEMAPADEAFADYARFLKASIQRYGPEGDAQVPFTPIVYWQVWNEPNIKNFWGPKPDAAAFVKLMRVVQQETAGQRDKIKLVHAGLSKPDLIFFWQLWEADPLYGETFDIMAVHPYLFDWWDGIRDPEEMDGDDGDYAALGAVGSHDDPGYLGKVFNLQLMMNLKGFADKPIWVTEMGYFVADHRLGVTDQEQATRLTATLDFIRKQLGSTAYGKGVRGDLAANVQRIYWFSLEDYPSPDGLGTFGLYRADGSKRPAADVFRNLAKQVNAQ
ncbi:hypothetical protein HNE05_08195 [Aquipseudomonas campi]|uniref:Glycoside hydrolase family 42 N-terminal domain-containing protein n=1 Tax=Aquipseudomonas campi TaxID=2731681 RepID=A0A6M8F4A2_9GAMM|nr:hypothetical protein [Pseudomonas campi]QKE63344.1 hypothetical protein HNE05_08195 [Pseudomonas campi]